MVTPPFSQIMNPGIGFGEGWWLPSGCRSVGRHCNNMIGPSGSKACVPLLPTTRPSVLEPRPSVIHFIFSLGIFRAATAIWSFESPIRGSTGEQPVAIFPLPQPGRDEHFIVTLPIRLVGEPCPVRRMILRNIRGRDVPGEIVALGNEQSPPPRVRLVHFDGDHVDFGAIVDGQNARFVARSASLTSFQ